jgi:hypothetical protein
MVRDTAGTSTLAHPKLWIISPLSQQYSRQRGEQGLVEALVTEPADEALGEGVLLRRKRRLPALPLAG